MNIRKIKIFENDRSENLENEINGFLTKLKPDIDVIDIQFGTWEVKQYSRFTDEVSPQNIYYCLIYYKEEV